MNYFFQLLELYEEFTQCSGFYNNKMFTLLSKLTKIIP